MTQMLTAGGNDTMDTGNKVNNLAADSGYKLVMHRYTQDRG